MRAATAMVYQHGFTVGLHLPEVAEWMKIIRERSLSIMMANITIAAAVRSSNSARAKGNMRDVATLN